MDRTTIVLPPELKLRQIYRSIMMTTYIDTGAFIARFVESRKFKRHF